MVTEQDRDTPDFNHVVLMRYDVRLVQAGKLYCGKIVTHLPLKEYCDLYEWVLEEQYSSGLAKAGERTAIKIASVF